MLRSQLATTSRYAPDDRLALAELRRQLIAQGIEDYIVHALGLAQLTVDERLHLAELLMNGDQ